MTAVKSVSDGLRDCESETQLNLNLPLRISPGPRHLSRPLAAISTYDSRPDTDDGWFCEGEGWVFYEAH